MFRFEVCITCFNCFHSDSTTNMFCNEENPRSIKSYHYKYRAKMESEGENPFMQQSRDVKRLFFFSFFFTSRISEVAKEALFILFPVFAQVGKTKQNKTSQPEAA